MACLCFAGLTNAQVANPPVMVTAWGQHFGGRVIYTYQVQNLGTKPIKQVLVGHHPVEAGEGRAELSVVPVGSRSSFWLNAEGARSPAGWGALIVYPEESTTYFINWTEAGHFRKLWPASPPDPNAANPVPGNSGIAPGATLSGFAAVLPSVDLAFVTGHATVVYEDSSVNVPLTADDRVPPALTLKVDRLNQSGSKGEWAIFAVTFTASDNFDPEPSTRLDVLASPPGLPTDIVVGKNASKAWNVRVKNVPGTTYDFRVVSVDASGNQTTKSYTYSVPR